MLSGDPIKASAFADLVAHSLKWIRVDLTNLSLTVDQRERLFLADKANRFAHVNELALSATQLPTNAKLSSHFPHVKRLGIQFAKQQLPVMLQGLEQLTHLHLLRLYEFDMAEALKKAVPTLQAVAVELNRANTQILSSIAALPLTSITMQQGLPQPLTDLGVQALANCRGLTELEFRRCPEITDRALEVISQLPQLQTLVLSSCSKLTQQSIVHLSQCAGLRHLGLREAGYDWLEPLSKLTQLTHLSIDSWVSLVPKSDDPTRLKQFATHLPASLHYLALDFHRDNLKIDPSVLTLFIQQLSAHQNVLFTFNLYSNPGPDPKQLETVGGACVRSVNVEGGESVDPQAIPAYFLPTTQ
jgi:hypothetical protein